uniref:RloB-like protein n=1 Tax=Candidatus Kentrum sp. LFY TaxID=2126342 RepID=A0A450WZB6_9GAMM|nr:MAG: RloB-like protein [Candidatus Kentron sp. LFY]
MPHRFEVKLREWLLLHFEDGTDIASARQCTDRLERHLPGYDKGIDRYKITWKMISDAIERARKRDTPPCTTWPRTMGTTTVYRLVKNIRQNARDIHD